MQKQSDSTDFIGDNPPKITGVTLLGWIAVTLGAALFFCSFFVTKEPVSFSVLMGLGVTLFPAGIFTLLTDHNLRKLLLRQVTQVMALATSDLKHSIETLNKTNRFLEESQDLGLVRVYGDRTSALDKFLDYALGYVNQLAQETDTEKKSVVIVGSSLKGIWDDPRFADKLTKLIERGRTVECRFDFLLTHPHYSRYREGQESREKDDIAKEILHAISWLKARLVGSDHVKLYKGTPTCFLMATPERMLINPYPYQVEAYRCFCLEVVPSGSSHSIYSTYWVNHYKKPWEGEIAKEDHRLVVNALPYQYFALDGPIPKEYKIASSAPGTLADAVIIQDSGECYISVNVSRLPPQVAYDQAGSGRTIMQLGKDYRVCLLKPKTKEWVQIGQFQLNERRRGFWNGMLPDVEISAYEQIGVFSTDQDSTFQYGEDAPELKGSQRPILWQSLWRAFPVIEKTKMMISGASA